MKVLSRMLLCFIMIFSIVHFPKKNAHAGMITTSEVVQEMSRTKGERTVADFLTRDDVKNQLLQIGVNPIEASARLAALSDTEVKKLALDINKAKVGGDVVGILPIAILIVGILSRR